MSGLVVGAAALLIIFSTVLNPHTVTNPNKVAEQFGVTIHWSSTPINCAIGDTQARGCFKASDPNVIYVESALVDNPDMLNYTILHEIGHVMEHRLGQPLNECNADRFAQSLGATMGYYCPPR